MIAGDGGDSLGTFTSTFYYDHIKSEWITGPSLKQRRRFLAAGIVTDRVTNEKFVVVTGGGNTGCQVSKVHCCLKCPQTFFATTDIFC